MNDIVKGLGQAEEHDVYQPTWPSCSLHGHRFDWFQTLYQQRRPLESCIILQKHLCFIPYDLLSCEYTIAPLSLYPQQRHSWSPKASLGSIVTWSFTGVKDALVFIFTREYTQISFMLLQEQWFFFLEKIFRRSFLVRGSTWAWNLRNMEEESTSRLGSSHFNHCDFNVSTSAKCKNKNV